MPRMLQIRNVPDDVHRTLKIRAAAASMTLSDYLRTQIEGVARRPTVEELYARVQSDGPAPGPETSAHALRAERESR